VLVSIGKGDEIIIMNRNEINATLKRVDIKGKDYIEVDQRILAFWEMFPNGSIETELLNFDGESCIFRATILDAGAVIATGHAWEVKSGSYINKTSFIENCETSAVGRALGILGIGVIGSICSADEVSNAIQQQEAAKTHKNTTKAKTAPQNAPQSAVAMFHDFIRKNNSKRNEVHQWCKNNYGDDYKLTEEIAKAALEQFNN